MKYTRYIAKLREGRYDLWPHLMKLWFETGFESSGAVWVL